MSEELSASQLKELEADLVALKLELEDLLSLTESSAKPVKLKDNAGRLSRMDEMHNQSILLANRNVTKNRLKQTLEAQEKVKQDIYGECDTCFEPIAFKRLKAYPETSMCITCKSKVET